MINLITLLILRNEIMFNKDKFKNLEREREKLVSLISSNIAVITNIINNNNIDINIYFAFIILYM